MIKNIILDMGNVLLDYDPERILSEFCSSEEEKDAIRKELFNGPEWEMGDRGDIKDKDRFDQVKDRVDVRFHDALWKCADRWSSFLDPLPGAEEFCRSVKNKGFGIYVLSNASDLFYEYFPGFLPLDFFDGVYVSADHHMLKPDVRIYESFLELYGLKAAECLFIDDREINVEGARKAGISAVCFKGDFNDIIRSLH